MLVALSGNRGAQDLVRGTLFVSAQSAIADRLLDRAEARYVSDLQRPSQRCDRSYSGNRSESFDPFRQERIAFQRAHQGVFRLLASNDRLPAQLQQRPDAFRNLLLIGDQLLEIPNLVQALLVVAYPRSSSSPETRFFICTICRTSRCR